MITFLMSIMAWFIIGVIMSSIKYHTDNSVSEKELQLILAFPPRFFKKAK